MRDLRDPKLLGEKLLEAREHWNRPLSEVADRIHPWVPDYDANPSCIEKYGRPQERTSG